MERFSYVIYYVDGFTLALKLFFFFAGIMCTYNSTVFSRTHSLTHIHSERQHRKRKNKKESGRLVSSVYVYRVSCIWKLLCSLPMAASVRACVCVCAHFRSLWICRLLHKIMIIIIGNGSNAPHLFSLSLFRTESLSHAPKFICIAFHASHVDNIHASREFLVAQRKFDGREKWQWIFKVCRCVSRKMSTDNFIMCTRNCY